MTATAHDAQKSRDALASVGDGDRPAVQREPSAAAAHANDVKGVRRDLKEAQTHNGTFALTAMPK
jgi:hypothetical protein